MPNNSFTGRAPVTVNYGRDVGRAPVQYMGRNESRVNDCEACARSDFTCCSTSSFLPARAALVTTRCEAAGTMKPQLFRVGQCFCEETLTTASLDAVGG